MFRRAGGRASRSRRCRPSAISPRSPRPRNEPRQGRGAKRSRRGGWMTVASAGHRKAVSRPSRCAADPTMTLLIATTVAVTCVVLLFGGTILWLSVSTALPGDPDWKLTLGHYVELLTDRFVYGVFVN